MRTRRNVSANMRTRRAVRDPKPIKPGDRVEVIDGKGSNLRLGAKGMVIEVYKDGVAMLNVMGATGFVPVRALRVISQASRDRVAARDEKPIKRGDKVTVAKAGNHPLVVGGLARVVNVQNNGIAMLDVKGATAFVHVQYLRHTRPGDAKAWRERTDLAFPRAASKKKPSRDTRPIRRGDYVRVLDDGSMLFTGVQWKVVDLDRLGYTVTLKSPSGGNLLTIAKSRVRKLDV